MPKRIAVIGAGPKGAAIAAKAGAMRLAGHPEAPMVVVYEKNQAGAAWCGRHGYTDGIQALCTPAERDLGFPYDRVEFGGPYCAAIAQRMQEAFSWQAFCVAQGSGSTAYEDWLLRGRKPPSHGGFVRYLDFAITRSAAGQMAATVDRIDYLDSAGQWVVHATDSNGTPSGDLFDAVVVTGSGPPWNALTGAGLLAHSFNSANFWSHTNLTAIRSMLAGLADPPGKVVIVGAGGGAAAVAQWFVVNGLDVDITIIGREPTLYTRRAGYFDDRLFTDIDTWKFMPLEAKRAFLRHSTAGVVWERVLDVISQAEVNYVCADAVEVVQQSSLVAGMPPQYALKTKPVVDRERQRINRAIRRAALPPIAASPSSTSYDVDVLIDARGFNRMAFVDDMGVDARFAPMLKTPSADVLEQFIDETLQFRLPRFPLGLHVPSLGSIQSPAATNLMALGWISNAVLLPYC